MKSRYLFFTFFACQALPGRFNSLFFQAHGLSDAQIGILFGLSNLVSLASTPLFSVLADKCGSRTRVILYLHIIATVSFLSLAAALPSIGLIPPSAVFPYILTVRTIYAFFARPNLTILTAVCVAQLKERHGKRGGTLFGHERLYGTISWALFSLLQGIGLDFSGMHVGWVYVANLTLSVVFIANLIAYQKANGIQDSNAVAPQLPSDSNESPRERNNDGNLMLLLKTTKQVIFSKGLSSISFFILLACLSMGANVVAMLQFLYFFNELATSTTLCGIAVFVTVLFEVPMFAHGPALLDRFGSVALMVLAAVAYGIRAVGYGIVPLGWYVILLEPLHGITFAAMQSAGVEYVASFAVGGADATAQSVFTLVRTLAGVVGVSIGGVIMQRFSGRVLYLCFGILVLIATALFLVIRVHLNSKANKRDQVTESDPLLRNNSTATAH